MYIAINISHPDSKGVECWAIYLQNRPRFRFKLDPMAELAQRFPRLANEIFDSLDNQSLANCYAVNSSHLSDEGQRCWLQYTFVNPFESDNTNFTKSVFILILRPHGGLFEKMDFEIEAFALEKQWWNPADWQWTESWETRIKGRFRDN